MVEAAMKYDVTYELDEQGWWVASVRRDQMAGCHTQGRTIRQTRKRILGALKAAGAVRPTIGQEQIKVPASLQALLNELSALRAKDEALHGRIRTMAVQAVTTLRKRHVGLRDASELLKLSHQRLHQIMHEPPRRRE
jgi:predicted RNase H-like HicB family nuclease